MTLKHPFAAQVASEDRKAREGRTASSSRKLSNASPSLDGSVRSLGPSEASYASSLSRSVTVVGPIREADDDDDEMRPLALEVLFHMVVNRDTRHALGLAPLGKGAYAHVVTFTAKTPIDVGARDDDGDDGDGGDGDSEELPSELRRCRRLVPACEVAVKIGVWSNEGHFRRECSTQSLAADRGLAPEFFGASWRETGPQKGASMSLQLECF